MSVNIGLGSTGSRIASTNLGLVSTKSELRLTTLCWPRPTVFNVVHLRAVQGVLCRPLCRRGSLLNSNLAEGARALFERAPQLANPGPSWVQPSATFGRARPVPRGLRPDLSNPGRIQLSDVRLHCRHLPTHNLPINVERERKTRHAASSLPTELLRESSHQRLSLAGLRAQRISARARGTPDSSGPAAPRPCRGVTRLT